MANSLETIKQIQATKAKVFFIGTNKFVLAAADFDCGKFKIMCISDSVLGEQIMKVSSIYSAQYGKPLNVLSVTGVLDKEDPLWRYQVTHSFWTTLEFFNNNDIYINEY